MSVCDWCLRSALSQMLHLCYRVGGRFCLERRVFYFSHFILNARVTWLFLYLLNRQCFFPLTFMQILKETYFTN